MPKADVQVGSQDGIHARPAAEIARLTVVSKVQVKITRADGKSARGDSILELMTLGIKHADTVTIEVIGDGAEELLQSLTSIVGTPRLH